jgi:hypothetical protein
VLSPAAFARLGDDVRKQLAFQPRNLVFQHQLALFQAADLELIEGHGFADPIDHVVEVTVFQHQFLKLVLELFAVLFHRRVSLALVADN